MLLRIEIKQNLMKKILFILFILTIVFSCKNNNLPIELACFKHNEADSIINNYQVEDKALEFKEFTALFGFKLCVNEDYNKTIFKKLIKENKIKDSLLYINQRIKPFYVKFDKINNQVCEISFHSFQYDKYLTFPDNYNFLSDKDDLIDNAKNELENEIKGKGYNIKKNENEEDLKSNFENLLTSLIKKYGKYNFTENNDCTKTVYNNYDDQVKYQNYYWIIENTLITLKYEFFIVKEKFKNYEDIKVETSIEDIHLTYENITLNKQKKEIEIEAYKNEFKEQFEKENSKKIEYENSKDSLNKDDQTEISKNL